MTDLEVETSPSLAGGRLMAAISNSIVSIMREHYGRGPMKAKSCVLDDALVVVLRDSGFTELERTLIGVGRTEQVSAMRNGFQDLMADRYREAVEQLTGRRVFAYLAKSQVDPEIVVKAFFLDRPLDPVVPCRDG